MPTFIDSATSPWLTWAIYALYCLAAAIALYATLRYRRRAVEREAEFDQRVEQEVRCRTADLEQQNAELHDLNAQLLEASLTDSLTGLHNRRFFLDQVAKDIALARRRHHREAANDESATPFDLAFLMVDLDHFKSINDAFGHTAGDHVLVEVRSILLECCRSSDIVIRWGGDEFLVLARDIDGEQDVALAERIRTTVKAGAFRVSNDKMLRTTCSIGLAHYPFVRSHPSAISWEQVVQLADSAMYEAKRTRDAWVSFSSTPSTLRRDGILSLAREAPETLVEEGRLEIRRSSGSAAVNINR